MKLVRARFRDHIDDRAGIPAELRIESIGEDPKLLDGIRGRLHSCQIDE